LFIGYPIKAQKETKAVTLAKFAMMCSKGKKGCVSGDCQNGSGVYIYDNCEVYQGYFEDGKRNGYGEYGFKKGSTINYVKGMWEGDNYYIEKNGNYITIDELRKKSIDLRESINGNNVPH